MKNMKTFLSKYEKKFQEIASKHNLTKEEVVNNFLLRFERQCRSAAFPKLATKPGKNHILLLNGGIGTRCFQSYVEEAISEFNGENFDVLIKSPGGYIAEGFDIAATLKRQSNFCNVYVDTQAASIASVIALSGKKLFLTDEAEFLVHSSSIGYIGSVDKQYSEKLRQAIEWNNRRICSVYCSKSQKPEKASRFYQQEVVNKGIDMSLNIEDLNRELEIKAERFSIQDLMADRGISSLTPKFKSKLNDNLKLDFEFINYDLQNNQEDIQCSHLYQNHISFLNQAMNSPIKDEIMAETTPKTPEEAMENISVTEKPKTEQPIAQKQIKEEAVALTNPKFKLKEQLEEKMADIEPTNEITGFINSILPPAPSVDKKRASLESALNERFSNISNVKQREEAISKVLNAYDQGETPEQLRNLISKLQKGTVQPMPPTQPLTNQKPQVLNLISKAVLGHEDVLVNFKKTRRTTKALDSDFKADVEAFDTLGSVFEENYTEFTGKDFTSDFGRNAQNLITSHDFNKEIVQPIVEYYLEQETVQGGLPDELYKHQILHNVITAPAKITIALEEDYKSPKKVKVAEGGGFNQVYSDFKEAKITMEVYGLEKTYSAEGKWNDTIGKIVKIYIRMLLQILRAQTNDTFGALYSAVNDKKGMVKIPGVTTIDKEFIKKLKTALESIKTGSGDYLSTSNYLLITSTLNQPDINKYLKNTIDPDANHSAIINPYYGLISPENIIYYPYFYEALVALKDKAWAEAHKRDIFVVPKKYVLAVSCGNSAWSSSIFGQPMAGLNPGAYGNETIYCRSVLGQVVPNPKLGVYINGQNLK